MPHLLQPPSVCPSDPFRSDLRFGASAKNIKGFVGSKLSNLARPGQLLGPGSITRSVRLVQIVKMERAFTKDRLNKSTRVNGSTRSTLVDS